MSVLVFSDTVQFVSIDLSFRKPTFSETQVLCLKPTFGLIILACSLFVFLSLSVLFMGPPVVWKTTCIQITSYEELQINSSKNEKPMQQLFINYN